MLLNDLEYQFDITALTETWHNDNKLLVINIYSMHFAWVQKICKLKWYY